MVTYTPLNLKLRAGYRMEEGRLKHCVIYLQGLGDSIRNHNPYFSALNQAGYRVIYFDYLGQGGSEGSMNSTLIKGHLPINATKQMTAHYTSHVKPYEIPEQADFIWSKYQGVKNSFGQDCSQSKKLVIGWSTGGLTAYRMAAESRTDGVILIAPGIHPRTMVGTAAENWSRLFLFQQVITEDTLTRNKFEKQPNPHVDPIKPKSPFHVLKFAMNLLSNSYESHHWKIPDSVRGLVFLSGVEDTYVDRDSTVETIKENTKYFSIHSYDGALHEIDNETDDVTKDMYLKTIQFLDQF
jgi:alpha-beta hydrolase superfamily lysophospholipase